MTAPFGPAGQSGQPDDATKRPARVDSVSIATELWIVVILGQLIAFIAQYPTYSDEARRRVVEMGSDVPREQAELLSSSGVLIASLAIAAVGLSLISGLIVWMARQGYTWARVLLAALGFFLTFNLIFSLFSPISPQWVMVPLILSGIAGLGASVLLMRRDADKYCRDMAAYRRARKSRSPAYGFAPAPQHPPHDSYPPQNPYSPGQQARRDDSEEGRGSGGQS